mmetsp:Transcript_46005/g.103656  ORF Transcript_46005/g.103656 Transcript_46005/m.103656 type:complete len:253 (-) Transcript_46005:310-1068(-)
MGTRDGHPSLLRRIAGLCCLVGRRRGLVAPRDCPILRDAARSAHVRQLDEAVDGEQDVVGLEVAVEHVQLVQVLCREHDLGRVEDRTLVRVRATHQIGVHVATLDEIEHKAQVILSLECISQCYDERVLHACQHLLLPEDGVRLVLRNQDALIDDLDCVELAAILLLCEQHHPEAARAEEAVEVELGHRHHLALFEFELDKLSVEIIALEAREYVEPHHLRGLFLDLVEYIRPDEVWLEGRLDVLSQVTLHR